MIKIFLPKFWYRRSVLSYTLLPFAWIYQSFFAAYKYCYRFLPKIKFPVPIIVVGNITVGGTGKTPLVIYLAELLKLKGYKVGVVSRGYGRKCADNSLFLTASSKAIDVGDEPLLIFHRTGCPVVVDKDRVNAVKQLLKLYNCDVVISDDGLQHYNLSRDMEIVVIDARFKFGNGFCLPAGPLREPISRLKSVDFVIKNSNTDSCSLLQTDIVGYSMCIVPVSFINVKDPSRTKSLDEFKGSTVHGVAGIAMPEKFFYTLGQLGLQVIDHPFPDHYVFNSKDFAFKENEIVIMTEKDAIKCREFVGENFWYLEIKVRLEKNLEEEFYRKVTTKLSSPFKKDSKTKLESINKSL